MGKAKKVSEPDPVEIPAVVEEPSIRILFHGRCLKLSARGVGDLEYEIGLDTKTQEALIRIAGNASSGAYSTKWVNLNEVQSLLAQNQEETFKGVILHPLYAGQSTSNIGYLAAILKAEGVLERVDNQPSALKMGTWTLLLDKIEKLKEEGASLPDHIGQAAEKRKKFGGSSPKE